MPTKTAELTGAQLDFWVAKAEGQDKLPGFRMGRDGPEREYDHLSGYRVVDHLTYSSNWSRGGPIIERERIATVLIAGSGAAEWCAFAQGSVVRSGYFEAHYDEAKHRGPTPLIAAMRCYVASKFGEEV